MNSTPSNPSRRIDRFVEEHRYLSNFFLCDVRDDAGNLYASVEHAYQAAKARTETERLHIASAPTAKKAKHRGSKVPTDSAWEARRLEVMRSLLVKKFAPGSELAAKLLSTGDAELVEGNIWGDRFWGVHEGVGENHLGRLLMDVRIQLRESATGGPMVAPSYPGTEAMEHPLVSQARALAIASHDGCGHKRSDGQPYWTHPQRVVATLAGYAQPPEVLAAAWLHDVPEDCPKDEAGCRELLARIAVEFGREVAALVTEVTNYFGPEATMEEKQARLREHARTMSDGAKWIKLADRLDNISGMVGWSAEKRRRYAVSTDLLLLALRPWPAGAETLAAKIAAATAPHV